MESALQQLKEEVERICAANGRTEKQLQSLISRLDDTKVSFCCSACVCGISQHCVQIATEEFEGLKGEVQQGFASLQARIDDHKDRINASRLEWQKTFGSSTSDS